MTRLKRKDGGEIRKHISTNNILDSLGNFSGSLSIVTDITERKRSEHAPLDSELQFRPMFENSMDGVLLTAPDGRIFMANPAACAILGRTEKEICDSGREGIVDPTDSRLPIALEMRRRHGKTIC